ncbi:MAG: type IV secretion system DNA-binding domain-containing protein, partial [Proteobacteria bacterium]|nr:type IV secretion system DNA-binding domain-containing protein [Pseudomonadota bacterium]
SMNRRSAAGKGGAVQMKNEGSLVIVTGCYGSGKTEYAANLAAAVREQGKKTVLVDLDVVNPYFRSRDVRGLFAQKDISVVAPEGSYSHADLPMLSPRIRGTIQDASSEVILDVGGDPMGARALAQFTPDILARGYDMRLVTNTRRPENRTVDEILSMAANIEAACGLLIGELVANSHLMEETTEEVVAEGAAAAAEAAQRSGRKFSTVCVLADIAPRLDLSGIRAEVFVLEKFMKKPWEQTSQKAWRI